MATISQRISLEGAEDIRKQLAALGEAGAQAFNQIRDAASQPILNPAQFNQSKEAIDQLGNACASLSETLGTISGAGETAAEGTSKLAQTSEQAGDAITNVAEAATKATSALSNFTIENAKSGSEIVKNTAHAALYGAEIYSLVARHESLTVALVKMALGGSAASVAFETLVGVLGGAVVAIGGITIGIGAAAVAVAALGAAATAAAAPYEKLNNTLQTLSANTGESFNSLQRGEALFTQLGTSTDTFRIAIGKLAEELKNLDVGAELQKSADEGKKAATDALQAEKELLGALLKRQEALGVAAPVGTQERLLEIERQLKDQTDEVAAAEAKLAAARERQAVAAANNLAQIVEQVKAIEEGQKGITFDSLTKGETILKALAISLKQAGENGQVAGKVLLDFIANVDRLNAVAAGAKFGLSEADVDRIRRAHGELGTFDEIWKRIQSNGVLIPPESAEAFERMRIEIENVERAQTRLQQAWDSTIFARFGAQVSSTLNSLKAAFINFVASAVESFNKFVDALPAAVDKSMAQVKQIWFAGWAAMAEAAATFFSAIGLDRLAGQLRAMAEGWRQSAEAAAAASADAGKRIAEAWDKSGQAAADAAQKTKGVAPAFVQGAEAAVAAVEKLRQQWTDGTISLEEYIRKVQEVKAASPLGSSVEANKLRQQWIDGTISLEQYKSKLGELKGQTAAATQKFPDPFTEANKGAEQYKQKIGELQQQNTLPAPTVDWSGVVLGAQEVITAISVAFQTVWGNLAQGAQTAASGITSAFSSVDIVGTLGNQIDTLISMFRELESAAIAAAKAEAAASSGGNGSGLPFASGGFVGGRGTGTSDSNLAWLSRGEYVMTARATQQPGVLAFLEALRRSGGNLSRVLDGMGRFALGGMVAPRLAAIPAFAKGGLNGGGSRVLNLTIGTETFRGLSVPESTAQSLERFAVHSQIASTGRKPSWRR